MVVQCGHRPWSGSAEASGVVPLINVCKTPGTCGRVMATLIQQESIEVRRCTGIIGCCGTIHNEKLINMYGRKNEATKAIDESNIRKEA